MALGSISTYGVRAFKCPSDSDDFLVNLQSSEQATKETNTCMKRSSTETVSSASKTLPCQIVFHVFFGVMKACKEREREPCTEIPLLEGRQARWHAVRLPAEAALCLAVCLSGVLGRYYVSWRVPLALWNPASPCCKRAQGQRAGEPGLCGTAPASEQVAAWDWQGEQLYLCPLGWESSEIAVLLPDSLWERQPQKIHKGEFTFSYVQILYFLWLEQSSGLENLSFLLRCVSPPQVHIRFLLFCWHQLQNRAKLIT